MGPFTNRIALKSYPYHTPHQQIAVELSNTADDQQCIEAMAQNMKSKFLEEYQRNVSRYSQWKRSNPRKAKVVNVMKGLFVVGASVVCPAVTTLMSLPALAQRSKEQQEEPEAKLLNDDSLCPAI